jgi:hypothetical protein
MDHARAVDTQAVEKYLIGDLKGAVLDEFEEHFFDCSICAEEVRTGVLLADNAAAEFECNPALKPEAAAEKQPGWKKWFQFEWRQPAFVMPLVALVVVAGAWVTDHRHLGTELAQVTAPQSVTVLQLEDARGAEPAAVAPGSQFVSVSFFLESPSKEAGYTVEISGEGIAPITVPAGQPSANNSFNLLIPAAKLKPGRYTFAVRAGESKDAPVVKTFRLNVG